MEESMRNCCCDNSGFHLLLQVLELRITDSSLLPYDTPAEEECSPQQPQTQSHMPQGAALLSMELPVMLAPGFLTAKTNPPPPHSYEAPAKESVVPQQLQTESHTPLGVAPPKLEQAVMPAPGFLIAKTNTSFLHSNNAPAKEKCVSLQRWTERYMPQGAAPLSLQQPVMPAPGFLTAKTNPSFLHSNNAPAKEKFVPEQPWTQSHMPLGAAPLRLEQLVILEPGFLTAKTKAFLRYYNAPAKERVVPQRPWTQSHMPLGAAPLSKEQPVMPVPQEECGPQQPWTGRYNPLGAALLSMQQPVRPATQEKCGPQQPQTQSHQPLGAAPLRLEQPVMPVPQEECGPQQPQTESMALGVAALSMEQPVMPAPGFHSAQTGIPILPPYHVPAEERFCPQKSQTGHYMSLGAAPFSLQPPVMPAPGPALPRFQSPSAYPPNYRQAAYFSHSQVNNGTVVSRPQGLQGTNLVPVGCINGKVVYGVSPFPAPPVASSVASNVPVVNALVSRKKRFCRKPHDESMPYVKKPPNAFMLFRMEQRSNVVVEIQNSDCAAVNRQIGYRWKSLSKDEQAKYYEEAEKLKHLHTQAFPDWSFRDNYAKKRKRVRRKHPDRI